MKSRGGVAALLRKAAGSADPRGLAVLSGIGIGAAFAGAWAAHLLAGFFYVAFLAPAAWGLGLGLAMAAAVRTSRWPNPRAALAAGLAVPLLSGALFHAFQNGRLRDRGVEQLGSLEEYREVLRERTGGTGFWAELSLRAETGMNVSRPGRRGPKVAKPMISGAAMYLYWVLELALIAAAGAIFPLRAARRPFCARCRRWYIPAGAACVAAAQAETALRALERRDFAVFTGCLVPNGSSDVVSMEMCPACTDSPVRLVFRSDLQDSRGRGRRRTLYDRMLSRESLYSLRIAGFVLGDPRGRRAGT